jgi:type IV secretory pathway ATPase VirB11/archaellum biosynthesis ATPase
VKPYTLADGVDDAMRMSPDYLVIGEVRDGMAAMSLFRALRLVTVGPAPSMRTVRVKPLAGWRP